jgi:hypothetical protein
MTKICAVSSSLRGGCQERHPANAVLPEDYSLNARQSFPAEEIRKKSADRMTPSSKSRTVFGQLHHFGALLSPPNFYQVIEKHTRSYCTTLRNTIMKQAI